VALAAGDDGFLVLDTDGTEAFSSGGQPTGFSRLPWVPDWTLSFNRRPLLYHQAPFQTGPEDLSHRITVMPGGYGVLASSRADGLVPSRSVGARASPMTLFAISRSGTGRDSVRSVAGPVREASLEQVLGAGRVSARDLVPPLAEPLFGGRPLTAGSNRWLAVFDPAPGVIEVRTAASRAVTIVDWPRVSIPVSDSMRVHFARHQMMDIASAAPSDSLAASWAEKAQSAGFDSRLRFSRSYPFANSLADVAALFADGDCLWLVGTDPRDFTDGTSHWGIAVNVRALTVSGLYRLARRGMQLREIGHGFAYSQGRSADGGSIVERTPLPRCGERGTQRE